MAQHNLTRNILIGRRAKVLGNFIDKRNQLIEEESKRFELEKQCITWMDETEAELASDSADAEHRKILKQLQDCSLGTYLKENERFPRVRKPKERPCNSQLCRACFSRVRVSQAFGVWKLRKRYRKLSVHEVTIIPPQLGIRNTVMKDPNEIEGLMKKLQSFKRQMQRVFSGIGVKLIVGIDVSWNYFQENSKNGVFQIHFHGLMILTKESDRNLAREAMLRLCPDCLSNPISPNLRVRISANINPIVERSKRALQMRRTHPEYIKAMLSLFRVSTYTQKTYFEQKGIENNPNSNNLTANGKNPMQLREKLLLYKLLAAMRVNDRLLLIGVRRRSYKLEWLK